MDHKLTLKAAMIAAFPDIPAMIQGEPTMQEFLGILRHLLVCSQSHKCSRSALNLLHVCLPASLYAVDTQDPYPNNYVFPGDLYDFSGLAADDMTGKSKRYAEWKCIMKWDVDQNTMPSLLTHRSLSLIQSDGLSSQVMQHAMELDHGSLSVVGFCFATKYANYFDLQRSPILTAFCAKIQPPRTIAFSNPINTVLHHVFMKKAFQFLVDVIK